MPFSSTLVSRNQSTAWSYGPDLSLALEFSSLTTLPDKTGIVLIGGQTVDLESSSDIFRMECLALDCKWLSIQTSLKFGRHGHLTMLNSLITSDPTCLEPLEQGKEMGTFKPARLFFALVDFGCCSKIMLYSCHDMENDEIYGKLGQYEIVPNVTEAGRAVYQQIDGSNFLFFFNNQVKYC